MRRSVRTVQIAHRRSRCTQSVAGDQAERDSTHMSVLHFLTIRVLHVFWTSWIPKLVKIIEIGAGDATQDGSKMLMYIWIRCVFLLYIFAAVSGPPAGVGGAGSAVTS